MLKRKRQEMGEIVFVDDSGLESKVAIGASETVLQAAVDGAIDLANSCEGMGSCGTCRVFVLSSATPLEPRNDVESERASDLAFAENERLACQIRPQAGMRLQIPSAHKMDSHKSK